MLPSSQVDTNPFESIPHDPSRTATPTPSPNESSTALSPQTPFPNVDAPFLSAAQTPDPLSSVSTTRAPSRSLSSTFVSSPLNPNSATTSPYAFVRPRPVSRGSVHLSRIASEDSQALGSQLATSQRGSMVLWRLASTDDQGVLLPPPTLTAVDQRTSIISTSGESIWTLSSDSKYPSGPPTAGRGGLVPYAWDPSVDDDVDGVDDDDILHRPESVDKPSPFWNPRGIFNVGVLVLLIGGLLVLFIAYPVIAYVQDNSNIVFFENSGSNTFNVPQTDLHVPSLIDPDTPNSAKSRVGYDGNKYNLVFSDEFNLDGRTFNPGDDPYWEAVDLWYWVTGDQEWYDPGQVYTANGSLHIRIDNVATNGMSYRSGMLQSWNKFCFTSGYIEVAASLPGPNAETRGYWPGIWTMGNLARPGYGATTDGMWPYTYDACDVGTLPNQTWVNGTGPAAALNSSASKAKYNYSLSYLSGQRLSACTCPGEDHPGPSPSTGRGAPEIDVFEAEHNKQGSGGVISQSAQFAPFTSDYTFLNDTDDEWKVYNPSISHANDYKGSAVQQAVSGLTELPPDVFEGSGGNFHTFGFEYFANPQQRQDGYITWMMDNNPTVRMGAAAVGPDQGPTGSGVSQRLIPEEPMSIVFNLAMSSNWQTIDLSTMTFPAEMRIDYVRVYQREGNENVGCDPPNYPTMKYINDHPVAYSNPQLQYWTSGAAGANYTVPKSSLRNGC